MIIVVGIRDSTGNHLGVFIDEDEIVIDYKLAKEIGATHYRECLGGEVDYYKLSDCSLKLLCYSSKCEEWNESISTCAVVLAKIKPIPKRTRTEYEKVTESIFDLRDEFERGELSFQDSEGDWVSVVNESELVYFFDKDEIYRKVEKEIDWREEVHAKLQSDYHWSTPIAEVINDESDCFLELCRVALRASGEIE